MSAADSVFLFGLLVGVAIGFSAGVLVMRSTVRHGTPISDNRHEYELDLAPTEFRSER